MVFMVRLSSESARECFIEGYPPPPQRLNIPLFKDFIKAQIDGSMLEGRNRLLLNDIQYNALFSIFEAAQTCVTTVGMLIAALWRECTAAQGALG
jgi:hypothetical protein